jgi:hypothetical protein
MYPPNRFGGNRITVKIRTRKLVHYPLGLVGEQSSVAVRPKTSSQYLEKETFYTIAAVKALQLRPRSCACQELAWVRVRDMPKRECELLFITMIKKRSQRQTFNDDQKRYQR